MAKFTFVKDYWYPATPPSKGELGNKEHNFKKGDVIEGTPLQSGFGVRVKTDTEDYVVPAPLLDDGKSDPMTWILGIVVTLMLLILLGIFIFGGKSK